jgi:uncharacterized protein YkwD
MSRHAALLATALFHAALLALPQSVAARDTPGRRDETRVFDLVNEARSQGRRCGGESYPPAPPLVLSRALDRAAQVHARDMARKDYFSHIAPDGSHPKDRVQREGYELRLTGENIAFGAESAEEVMAGWLASPGHCANIMDARFREFGVAVATGRKRGHHYWVQEFGWPR